MDMLKIKKARKAFDEKLAQELPAATRDYLTALDAKCLRLLRGEPESSGEREELDRLLTIAAQVVRGPL